MKLALEVREASMPEPSEPWRQRATAGRISVSLEHEDYPALLAEALDVVHAHRFDISAAATHHEVTASQLTKLLKSEASALDQVNRGRDSLGLAPLR